MILKLVEKPSVYYRGDAAVVIFPSIPYWFSASRSIADVLDALEYGEENMILDVIIDKLEMPREEAATIFDEVKNLLHVSGALAINGTIKSIPEYSPNFQVNNVENVLVIATTQQCNLTCPMCYACAGKEYPYEMTTQEIRNIIDQLAEMPWQNAASRIALTGGELFLRPDAVNLIEYVHTRGYFVQVNTNATVLEDEHIERLSKLPNLKMSISLDGSTASTHEYIRGNGTFHRTIDAIRTLCGQGISVAINMFVHAGNIDDISETLCLADSLGAEGFNCLNMMHVGRGNTLRTKKLLTPVPLAVFYRKLFETVRQNARFQQLMMFSTFANQLMGIAGGVKSHGCGIGTNRAVYVKTDGSLYPCADTAVPAFRLGNLRTEKLADIWENSHLLRELRSLDVDTMNQQCASCDVRYLCGGNCRGENYQTTRELRNPHFKCAEIHDSILELMWILTEDPDLFACKVDTLYDTVNTYASTA